MKAGPLIAVLVSVVVVAGLYFAPKTTAINKEKQELVADSKTTPLDQKVDEAIAKIQNGGPPMEAIGMLLEVVEENPRHARAQFTLGTFSILSGQYEKAVDRFSKVIEIDPTYTDAYRFLGEAHKALEQNDKAQAAWEYFIEISQDEQARKEVKELLREVTK